MATIFVATSKGLQDWAGDVGLGKSIYKLGVIEDGTPEEALAGFAGHSDWKVLKTEPTEVAEEAAFERLGRKEKMADPAYYPRLRGARGIFKVSLVAVENAMLVAIALDNREPPKNFKVKPVDVAAHMIRNAVAATPAAP
jgi:hypothetical protein